MWKPSISPPIWGNPGVSFESHLSPGLDIDPRVSGYTLASESRQFFVKYLAQFDMPSICRCPGTLVASLQSVTAMRWHSGTARRNQWPKTPWMPCEIEIFNPTSAINCWACRKRNIFYRRKRKCRLLVKRCIALLLRRAGKLTLNQRINTTVKAISSSILQLKCKNLCEYHETA